LRTLRFDLLFTGLATGTATLVATGGAVAATLQVGPGQTYATPCAAIAAASPGDEIDIAAGTYTDTCEINPAGLHLKGVGGQPKIDLTGNPEPADYKGIYVVNGDDVTIENLELTGAAISDGEGGNGAGLRIQSNGVTVTHCFIHDNQDGILATATTGGGTLTIEYTEFANNGLGDACDAVSCVHNVYVGTGAGGDYGKLVFQFNWDHALATDTADKGHLLKSRALESDVLYNRITGETGHDSYEIDLPNGGLGIVVGNVIEKGPDPDNKILLDYGEEGYGTGTNTLYVVNNTFVNDDTASGATFIDVASGGALAAAHNNLFVGTGTLSNTGALSPDNLATATPMFVDPTDYDYHLQPGSPAIGKAVPAGSAGTFSLTPVFEYVQPLGSVARPADQDLGAFEYGTSMDGGKPSGDGGGSSGGGSSGSSSGGSANAGDGGTGGDAGAQPYAGKGAGCGCATAGARDASTLGLLAVLAALAARARRRR
jgi:MYXO-CTERM domain-containing protein